MSGGQLVVLDRLGRDMKRYSLPEGLATLGSDHACDIRFILPTVSPHHATVVVHANQTVVRNVSTGETLVNGCPVSVAALRHRDIIEIGGRALRWEYSDEHADRPLAPQPALCPRSRPVRGGGARRTSLAASGAGRARDVRLALELAHRASMPGPPARQVAVVQPQRRDTTHNHGQMTPARQNTSNKRSRASRNDSNLNTSAGKETETSTRKSTASRPSPRNTSLQNPTKASLWIESRKPQSRKGTPLRLAVLRRAHSACSVAKIQAPDTLDQQKQAAILLMTRHTPKRSASPAHPSFVVKKRTPRASPQATANKTPRSMSRASTSVTSRSSRTPGRTPRGRSARAHNDTNDVTSAALSDSDLSQSTSSSFRPHSSQLSPLLPSPKKSALKDPTAKKSARKTESIKFDLSNLENEQSQDVFFVSDVTRNDSQTDTDITLHYDSSIKSPSPRKSINSRSSKILERTLGTSISEQQCSIQSTLTPESSRPRKSSRGSVIVQKALDTSGNSRYSQMTTKSLSDESYDTTVASAFKTRTLSPRSPSQKNMESYSIVDLVSEDSNQTGPSVYNSMRSTKSTDTFGTPQNSTGRKTRSTIDPSLLTSSTPYVAKTTRGSQRSLSSPNITTNSNNTSQISRGSTRRSKSLSTPENSKHISVNSTRLSRASRSRSRINDSDLLLISSVSDEESSPKSSKRASRAAKSVSGPKSPIISPKSLSASIRKSKSVSSPESNVSSPENSTGRSTSILNSNSLYSSLKVSLAILKTKSVSPKSPILSPKSNISLSSRKTKSISSPKSPIITPRANTTIENPRNTRSKISISPSLTNGYSTPENRQSPVEIGTPILSIQSLLDSSQSSLNSLRSTKKGRASLRNKTIGGIPPKPKKGRASIKSKSFNFGARNTASRLSRDSNAEGTSKPEDVVTPKSAVKLVQEAVKNKHSTAKKPLSKRSIIDDLNESDIVKQLFNSPVKRKLSQSMTEFSRKQLFEDDDVESVKRPTRNTIALGRTPDNSILNETESYTPEVFVSPLGTPNNSPNLTGIKRLFRKQTPENDLRNVKGVKGLLRTPRTRRSVKNDLTRVSGVKNVFAKSPKNRLSDVRVKEVFAAAPKNDLRRVSGVKSLFKTQKGKSPKNDLTDVRGVKQLFKARSPRNDLRNVSGVKKVMRNNSPRNDLSDVRGVKKMFRQEKQRDNTADVSGIEELFNESNQSYRDSEALFDQLIGKPPIKAVYSRTFIKKVEKPRKIRRGGSLHTSIDEIIAKPEEWIQKELQKCLEKKKLSRELQKLATDTVEGNSVIRTSRFRNSTFNQSENAPRQTSTAENYSWHTLPIKKRSIVEVSSKDNSRVTRGSNNPLPIKKRALVHSTPVKGRPGHVLPELGRVSPIALDNSNRFITTVVEADLQTSRRNTKAKDASKVEMIVTSPNNTRRKASPKTSRAVISPKKTPVVLPKFTRKSAKNVSVSKNLATLVIAKKAPVISPKPAKTVEQVKSPSPKKRITRRQKLMETDSVANVDKPKSPKRKRGKRVSLVVGKPSPKMKPRPTAASAQASEQDVPDNKRRTRKNTAPTETVDKKSESAQKPARATRNRKTTEVAKEVTEKPKSKAPKTVDKVESVEESPAKTRGKKTEVSVEVTKRATRGKKSDAVEQKTEVTTRGKKADAVVAEQVPQKRGKKAEIEKLETQKRGKKDEIAKQKPVATKRGRKTEAVVEKVASPKSGQKTQEVESKPVRKGRNTKAVEEKAELPKRGRKADEKDEQKPAAQTRGRKTEIVKEVAQKRGRKADNTEAQISNTIVSPKGKRGQASEPVQETRRGRKAKVEVEVKPTRGASKSEVSRKRKSTSEEEVPSKVRKTRNGDVSDAKAKGDEGNKGRQTRGKQSVAVAAPTTRKRKNAETPVKPAKETDKRATRVVVKPASPAKRNARVQASPIVTKRSTRGKR